MAAVERDAFAANDGERDHDAVGAGRHDFADFDVRDVSGVLRDDVGVDQLEVRGVDVEGLVGMCPVVEADEDAIGAGAANLGGDAGVVGQSNVVPNKLRSPCRAAKAEVHALLGDEIEAIAGVSTAVRMSPELGMRVSVWLLSGFLRSIATSLPFGASLSTIM